MTLTNKAWDFADFVYSTNPSSSAQTKQGFIEFRRQHCVMLVVRRCPVFCGVVSWVLAGTLTEVERL